jgi:hypothetical protein
MSEHKGFDPQLYFPLEEYSSSTVNDKLKKTILNQFSIEEQKNRIELAACYRIFAHFGMREIS